MVGPVVPVTTIEWTDVTWNPTTGCDKVSPGCDHCYAMTMAKRLKGMGSAKYQRDGDPRTSGPGFGVSIHEDALSLPFSWRKPRKVFVNSMSDLFHKEVPSEFIAQVFATMALTPQHTYQILTKRHARMRSLLSDSWWEGVFVEEIDRLAIRQGIGAWRVDYPLPNVWLGVSVENQHWADIRIPALLKTPAAVRFLSCEPLLGPVDLTMVDWDGATGLCVLEKAPYGIDWVITGGESGRDARPVDPNWVRTIRDQCVGAGVAFLHKQWGGIRPKANGRELDGRTWDQYPAGAR